MKIIDKDGEWLVNPHQYRFVDGDNGNVFEPNDPVKVKVEENSWLAGQIREKVIVPTDDPLDEPKPPKGGGKK